MFKLIKYLLASAVFFVGFVAFSETGHAAVSTWDKGASVVPRNTTDFNTADFRQSMLDLKATGANYVTLIIPYYQGRYSGQIDRGWNTPTDESLIAAINYAQSIGLKVDIKMHLETYEGIWRAYIDPSGTERTKWFVNYKNILDHYARIGQSTGAERFTIGTEMIRMAADDRSGNTAQWSSMIASVRSLYSGKLTYSANWGEDWSNTETTRIAFWDDLDYIGISAYYYLGRDWDDNSVETLKSAWANWDSSRIAPLNATWGKPILFSEIGYRSTSGAHTHPWEYHGGGGYNATEQVNLYEALFQYWDNKSYVIGVGLWDWEVNPNAGGHGHEGYTPQNKPAEATMTKWFKGSGTTPPPPPTLTCSGAGTNAFNACYYDNIDLTGLKHTRTDTAINFEWGSGSPHTSIGADTFSAQWLGNFSFEAATYNFTVTADDGIRVYIDGTLVLDKWIDQPPTTYNFSRALTAGSHQIKVTYYENGGGATAKLSWTKSGGTTPPPPPPTAATVEIWWPTNGTYVSGTQPFQAIVPSMSLSNYNMYWQVDGGSLNLMHNETSGAPHKRAWVDVNGWLWNGNGPYKINFVARNLSGAVIAQKDVSIHISR